MAFPAGWPPRPASGLRSIRFYQAATAASANFSDNAYLFSDGITANTFKETPYLDPGEEATPAPLGVNDPIFNAGGSPVGTGRNPGDAIPFNPNLFLRGVGGASNFTLAGTTITFNDPTPTKLFTRDLGGKEIRIIGATSAGNDGTFRIATVPSPHSLTWENAGGASEVFAASGTYRIRTIDDAPPKEMIWAGTIRVIAETADVEISFDGVNVHGIIPAGTTHTYRNRYEAGIALRGVGATFTVEAW